MMLPYYKTLECRDLNQISGDLRDYLAQAGYLDPSTKRKSGATYGRLFNLETPPGEREQRVSDLLSNNPLLKEWMKYQGLLDLGLASIMAFWLPPGTNMHIHIDGVADRAGHTGTAVNIPVMNCDTGQAQWFEAEAKKFTWDEAVQFIDPNWESKTGSARSDLEYRIQACVAGAFFKSEGSVLVDEAGMNQATWVNTAIPHRGVNSGPEPLVLFSMRFHNTVDPDRLK